VSPSLPRPDPACHPTTSSHPHMAFPRGQQPPPTHIHTHTHCSSKERRRLLQEEHEEAAEEEDEKVNHERANIHFRHHQQICSNQMAGVHTAMAPRNDFSHLWDGRSDLADAVSAKSPGEHAEFVGHQARHVGYLSTSRGRPRSEERMRVENDQGGGEDGGEGRLGDPQTSRAMSRDKERFLRTVVVCVCVYVCVCVCVYVSLSPSPPPPLSLYARV